MAHTKVKYVMLGEYVGIDGDIRHREIDLCFSCAVRAAMENNPSDHIHMQTDLYEFMKCGACGNYIKDTIEI